MNFKFDSDYIQRARYRVAMVTADDVLQDSRVLKTAQTVSKLGFQVCLYGLNNEDASTRIESYPFEIVLLPDPRFEMERLGKWSADIDDRDWDEFTHIFSRHLQDDFGRKPPDFLHTHSMAGLAVGGKLYGLDEKHTFFWIHDVHEYVRGLDFMDESTKAFFCRIEEEFIHCPDVLTSGSSTLSDILQDFYSLKRKPSVIFSAPRRSDFDHYHPKDVRSALDVPQNAPLLVYIGNVKPTCGVEMLIEVLAMLPDAHLAIVTNSSVGYVEDLRHTAREMDVNRRIHFHPHVPFYNVTSFLRTATVGISFLQPNAETALSNELFEYIHAGLPSLVSKNQYVYEFVNQHDCGLTFEAGDARSLAEAVTRVVDHLHSEPSWRQSIQALSEQYSWEEQEAVIAGIYDALVPHKRCDSDSLRKGKNYSVLHLPVTGAGSANAFARAMKIHGISACSLYIGPNKWQYHADRILDSFPNDLTAGKEMLDDLISQYDIFHFHVRPVLYALHYPFPTGMDLILLRAANKKVFFHFRGGEARLASVFKKCSPYNYVSENPDNIFDRYKEDEQRIFIKFICGVCHRVFVLDPELQTYVPETLIVPRVVDLKKWAFVGTEPSEVLRVVHAPSRRVMKGTKEVLSAVEKLKSEGIPIELRLVEGVSNDEARELYKWADVVIDQLRVGWYGVLTIEAMALGKAVVCYIRDDLKHYLPYPLPLAVANPDNLYQVLKDLVSNPAVVRSLGLRGRKYVEELHDDEKITDILLRVYEAEGNSVDISKIAGFLSFQKEALVRPQSIRYILRYVVNKQNFVSFFRILRRDGVRVAVRKVYDLVFR